MFLLFGDNDSCVVIMQWKDYDMELQNMIDDEIREVIYSPTTLRDLKKFQDLLRRNYDRYEDMRPISKQPGKIYATAKAHKFDSLENITIKKVSSKVSFR